MADDKGKRRQVVRDAGTGEFTTREAAFERPGETVTETLDEHERESIEESERAETRHGEWVPEPTVERTTQPPSRRESSVQPHELVEDVDGAAVHHGEWVADPAVDRTAAGDEPVRHDPGPLERPGVRDAQVGGEGAMCGCVNRLDSLAPLDPVRALDPTAVCPRCGGITPTQSLL